MQLQYSMHNASFSGLAAIGAQGGCGIIIHCRAFQVCDRPFKRLEAREQHTMKLEQRQSEVLFHPLRDAGTPLVIVTVSPGTAIRMHGLCKSERNNNHIEYTTVFFPRGCSMRKKRHLF